MQPVLAQAPPSATPSTGTLYFKADVQADGVPINIEPDASLTPALQTLVRKRVAQWRYQVGSWQGKPVPMPMSQKIVAEVVPLPSGGFVLRIKEVSGAPMPVPADAIGGDIYRMSPPDYPQEARRRGVSGSFVYAVRTDAQGKPYDVELLEPEQQSRDMKVLDRAARTAIMKWTLATPKVDGVALDCRTVVPIEFRLGSHQEWVRPDMAPYRARLADACPATPELVTKVVGTIL